LDDDVTAFVKNEEVHGISADVLIAGKARCRDIDVELL